MKIVRFEDIEAWQLARELARKVYCLTKRPRFAKDFGFKGQIQDAAGSSMHNIAKGFQSSSVSFDMLSDHAQRCKVNYISPLMKSTYRRANLKMPMNKPDELVLQFMDL